MPNMTYCRFRNTLTDLRDCQEHMDADLDGDEGTARAAIVELCVKIAGDYGDDS